VTALNSADPENSVARSTGAYGLIRVGVVLLELIAEAHRTRRLGRPIGG
jgi:hypothetical protein